MDSQPVRCFGCGKVLTNTMYVEYVSSVEAGEEPMEILTRMKIRRRCCRKMLMTDVDHRDNYLKYPTFPDRIRLVGSKFTSNDVQEESSGEEESEEEEEAPPPKKGKAKAKPKPEEDDDE